MLFLSHQVELNQLEIDIYHYITQNLDKVIYMRIRDLADATHVSTTTILRFCKKFGCQGFSDFKLKLQMYVTEQKNRNEEIELVDELPYIEFLKRTNTIDFQQPIEESANILTDADLILCVGVGTSGVMASYASILFSSLFNLALPITDPMNIPLDNISSQLNKKICLFVISVSGENRDIIDYINQMKLTNATVVSITNSGNSTISKLSTVNIPYYTNTEMYKNTNITSQLPVTYIIEMIGRYANHLTQI
ncbi:MurR/RpiR family transcriptional regulator [Vagococcus xieshaowenii]|uniref:MurR/RpiR family transcriptional regulator n=1 Tax=Vagococcus xieshaowenii TaxID=2562451 RepID=A0A4Z0D7L0_9ENTE|nr:MurR/RpiR family transcriptional regulator [Vagococcus xieshaowenii]QCA29140.1 MurR/RpiR family transcriptional regulator [Vagococcus xieshaowenii]TFZ40883.1 MurR/RpiR family transcriptional regulator [Vagococcus xieshaowenii]